MIITTIFDFIMDMFIGFVSFFTIPSFPGDLTAHAHDFLDFIFTNSSLLGLFIRPSTIKAAAISLIVIFNFEHIWEWLKMAYNKLPFINN